MYDEIIEFMIEYEKADCEKIKNKIRQIRKDKGLTPLYFEKKVGINAMNYKQIEKVCNKYKPSLSSLIKIAYALDVELKDFII